MGARISAALWGSSFCLKATLGRDTSDEAVHARLASGGGVAQCSVIHICSHGRKGKILSSARLCSVRWVNAAVPEPHVSAMSLGRGDR